jgi:predicted nuclease with TOPRIM domain
MQRRLTDIRKELEERIATIQREITKLKVERSKLDEKLQDADRRMGALRITYESELERLGQPRGSLFAGTGESYRFAGMRVGQALKIIRQENPKITKEQAHKLLVKEGFAFGTKRSKSAVHFAWIGLERAKSG